MDFSRDKLTTLLVGSPNPVQLVVNANVLDRAEYFKRAMNGRWAESDSRTVTLPDDDPEIIKLYLRFVHTNDIMSIQPENSDWDKDWKSSIAAFHLRIANTYVLAERFMDSQTKNNIVYGLVEFYNSEAKKGRWAPFHPAAAAVVYEGTPEGSPMRRVVVDHWLALDSKGWGEEVMEQMPKEFFVEMTKVMAEKRYGRDWGCVRSSRDRGY